VAYIDSEYFIYNQNSVTHMTNENGGRFPDPGNEECVSDYLSTISALVLSMKASTSPLSKPEIALTPSLVISPFQSVILLLYDSKTASEAPDMLQIAREK